MALLTISFVWYASYSVCTAVSMPLAKDGGRLFAVGLVVLWGLIHWHARMRP